MPDHSDKFRKLASDCIAIARTNPEAQALLLSMAQTWNDLANDPAINFDALVREFNDRQVSDNSQPVAQQQQQIQPKKKE